MDFRQKANEALEQRGRLVAELRDVDADANLGDAEKRERVERLTGEIEAREAEARGYVEQGEREAEARDLEQRASRLVAPAQRAEQREAGPSLDEQFRAVARGEVSAFDIDLRAADANTAASQGGVGGGDAWAGNLVPVESFVSTVLESMRDRSPIFRLSRIVTTASGETLAWPRKTSRPGAAQVPEGSAYAKTKGGFDKFNLGATKYGTIVEATEEALSDAAVSLASILAQDAGEGVADQVAADAVAGLLSEVTLGRESAAAMTADDVISLPYDLVSGYRRRGVYLANDATLRDLRLLKDSNGQFLWQPSVQAGEPDRINGYAVETDPNMPLDSVEDAKPLLFGDFQRFIVRQVGSLRVVRSDEYGFDSDIVAWKVTWRGDFGLSDTQAIAGHTFNAV